MATLTIRNLDDETKARLRLQSARNQRSMEEEARNVLRQALATTEDSAPSLAALIHRRFRALGGVVLEIPAREPMRAPPRPAR